MNGFIRFEGVSQKWRRECRRNKGTIPIEMRCHNCHWVRSATDAECAKWKISFETSLSFERFCASQSVSQSVVRLPAASQQMTFIKNENIINSTTLFFVVGVFIARIPLLLLCRSRSVIGCMCHGSGTSAISFSYHFFSFFLHFFFRFSFFGKATAVGRQGDATNINIHQPY